MFAWSWLGNLAAALLGLHEGRGGPDVLPGEGRIKACLKGKISRN
jgi:hypothetical protein